MAYVRKTETLVHEILNKVRDMSETAQKPYEASTVTEDSAEYKAIADALENVSWKQAPDLKDKMPQDWRAPLTFDQVSVKVPAPSDCPDSGELNIRIERKGGFFMSPSNIGNSGYYRSSEIIFSEEDIPPVLMNWFKGGKSNEATKAGLAEKFEKVKNQLEAFMKQHASLNTAIKAMPEIEHYVPSHYIERLHAASPPRGAVQRAEKTAVEELEIDVNELTSAAVAHQIASSTS